MSEALIFGSHLQRIRDFDNYKAIEDSTLRALCRALGIGGCVALTGAGMSIDYGHVTWQDLVKKIVKNTKRREGLTDLERNYFAGLDTNNAAEFMSILDFCHKIYYRNNETEEFAHMVSDVLKSNPHRDGSKDGPTSLDDLIKKLNIRRIITINYDAQAKLRLESDLKNEARYMHAARLGSDSRNEARSRPEPPTDYIKVLDRLYDSVAELVCFALRTDRYTNAVVHLHGKIPDESDPAYMAKDHHRTASPLVLTETQYQRQYASNGARSSAVRNAYRLMLVANSLILAGCSLEDEDVLTVLRQFITDNPGYARTRPWFALMSARDPKNDRKYLSKSERVRLFYKYYYRYGIRCLFYPLLPSDYKDNPTHKLNVPNEKGITGKNFRQLLDEIHDKWTDYRRYRSKHPYMRVATLTKSTDAAIKALIGTVYLSRAPVYDENIETKNYQETKHFEPAFLGRKKEELSSNSTHFILADGGTGKGSAGYYAAHCLPESDSPVGFYTTVHFNNDFISILMSACEKFREIIDHTPSSDGCGTDEVEERNTNDPQSIVGQFFSLLEKLPKSCIFVIAGFERLLRCDLSGQDRSGSVVEESDFMLLKVGRAMNPEVASFLEKAIEFGRQHTRRSPGSKEPERRLIIMSSSYPRKLLEWKAAQSLELEAARRIGQEAAEKFADNAPRGIVIRSLKVEMRPDKNKDLEMKNITVLHRLSQHHLFLGDLLHSAITDFPRALKEMNLIKNSDDLAGALLVHLGSLELRIGHINAHERPDKIVGSIISFIQTNEKLTTEKTPHWFRCRDHLYHIIKALVLVTTPISVDVLFNALDEDHKVVKRADDEAEKNSAKRKHVKKKTHDNSPSPLELTREDFGTFLEFLHKNTRLVLKYRTGENDFEYTIHTTVRRCILRDLGGRLECPAEIHQFDLNDFASEPADVQPFTARGAEETQTTFDRLAKHYFKEAHEDHARSRAFIRASYGVLRAGWSATGLGRMLAEPFLVKADTSPLYLVYHRRLTTLLSMAVKHDELHTCGQSVQKGLPCCTRCQNNHCERAALNPDELSWLFNELGLVCYCQGIVPDAATFFGLGQRINEEIEGESRGYRQIVSYVNMASVMIDRARLGLARQQLLKAAKCAEALKESGREIGARIDGYLGIVFHLSGEREAALGFYGKAIHKLSNIGSLRGVSVFRRHRGNLFRSIKKFAEAERDLRFAAEVAQSGFHPDLVHFCRVSQAHLLWATKDAKRHEEIAKLDATLWFARSLGSARLESEVHRVKAWIELDHGDFDAATKSALECLWLARAHHQRLRMMSALEMLATITRMRGSVDESRTLFEELRRMAQRYQYQRGLDSADHALAEIGRRIDPTD